MVYVACRSIERCRHGGLDDLNEGGVDDGNGLHLGWSHHCNVGNFHGFGGGSWDVVGDGVKVAVVSGLVFIGNVVDMVLLEVVDLVLCVVSMCRKRVCFSSSWNSARVLESVGRSHSWYDLGCTRRFDQCCI